MCSWPLFLTATFRSPTYCLVSASTPFLLLMGPILVLLVSEQLKLTFSASKYSGKVVFWLLWPLNSLLIYLVRCCASSAPIDILDIGNLKSAFLAIKSGKKADFSLSVLLNPSYLPPCDLCTPSNVIFLLTCAIGVSKHSLFRIFGHKILQKGEFSSFGASESGLSPVQWVIQSTWSHIITYLCCWRLRALIIPLFWP